MAVPDWTPAQRAAITARGHHLLVSAAAGSGKTTVLVERLLGRITDPAGPLDLDRILVVTFGDEAADSIRRRVAAALGKRLLATPGDPHLARQLGRLGGAPISTLHGFCHRLLREYPYRVGLDPGFAVLDEGEALLLRLETVEAVLDEAFARDGPGSPLHRLAEAYGGESGGELAGFLLRAYDLARSQVDPAGWLRRCVQLYALAGPPAPGATPWAAPLLERARRQLAAARVALEEALALCASSGGPAYLEPILAGEHAAVVHAASLLGGEGGPPADWDTVALALSRLPLASTSLPKGRDRRAAAAAPGLEERVRGLLEEARAACARVPGVLTRSGATLADELQTLQPLTDRFVELVRAFDAAYRAAKAERGGVDFDDLQHLALRLLQEAPDVTLDLRRRYVEVLVDEYQDTNPVQEALLACLAPDEGEPGGHTPPGGPTRFLVGDVKQSIYRFRLADPRIFRAKEARYRGGGQSGRGRAGRVVVLQENFRSRRQVIDAVNFVFRQLMRADTTELDYPPDAELRYAAAYPPDPAGEAWAAERYQVELHLLEGDTRAVEGAPATAGEAAPETGDDGIRAADLSRLEREACLVARRLLRLVQEEQLPIHGQGGVGEEPCRPVGWGDIAILLRRGRETAATFQDVLQAHGIPVSAGSRAGSLATPEVATILAVLQVIDNPRQDIPLAAALHSPLFRFSAGDLLAIRLAAPAGELYDAVEAAAGGLGDLAARLRSFLATLERWRTASRRSPVASVIRDILEETGYLAYVSGLPDGARRRAHLEGLYRRAVLFSRFGRPGLRRFLDFVERLQAHEADQEAGASADAFAPAVRILTIHASKGLEFPVVVVAGLGTAFNRQSLSADILFHTDLGMGLRCVDAGSGVKWDSLPREAIQALLEQEGLAEELRLLYVALTRAREKLILVGSTTYPLGQQLGRWLARAARSDPGAWPLPDLIVGGARSFLDWLVPAVARHPAAAHLWRAAGATPPASIPGASEHSLPASPPGGPCPWRIELHPAAEVASLTLPAATPSSDEVLQRVGRLEDPGHPLPPALAQDLRRRLAWRYPYVAATRVPAKVTVTELKQRLPGLEEPGIDPTPFPPARVTGKARRPRFLAGPTERLTPAEVGVATHTVLQHVDLRGDLSLAGLMGQVHNLVRRELLRAAEAAAVDLEQLAAFFASPLGRRLAARPEAVRREVPFTLFLPADLVYPELAVEDPGERVMVQGTIDCLLQEAQGTVVIDFKTGRPEPDLLPHYRRQLQLYRRAVDTLGPASATEGYLVFLASTEILRVF